MIGTPKVPGLGTEKFSPNRLIQFVNEAIQAIMVQVRNISLFPVYPTGQTSEPTTFNLAKAGFLDGQYLQFTFHASAGTEATIPHDLGRVPVGVIPVIIDGDTVSSYYYEGGTAWTSSNIYLKASGNSAKGSFIVF